MSTPGDAKPVEFAMPAAPATFWQDVYLLTKPRLSALALLAVMSGYFMADSHVFKLTTLCETLLGTALVAVGASMLNQLLERNSDKRMQRTANRPLPAGRMQAGTALSIGAACAIVGLLLLAVRVNIETSLLAALTLGLYVFAYTPMKPLSTLNTLVGAVPGALPPLIGWAAAADGDLGLKAATLFAILFIWQLPHFLAIAWLYRKDYAAAGLKMLPTVDPEGRSTGRQMVIHSAALLPASLLPFFREMTGPLYFFSALALGVVFFISCVNFLVRRDDRAARIVFVVSIAYLPLLLAVMMFDKV